MNLFDFWMFIWYLIVKFKMIKQFKFTASKKLSSHLQFWPFGLRTSCFSSAKWCLKVYILLILTHYNGPFYLTILWTFLILLFILIDYNSPLYFYLTITGGVLILKRHVFFLCPSFDIDFTNHLYFVVEAKNLVLPCNDWLLLVSKTLLYGTTPHKHILNLSPQNYNCSTHIEPHTYRSSS